MYGAQKAKGLFTKLKYQKFQAPISKWDVLFKNDQMLWIVKKPNEKALKICHRFLWEVIYVHFYNWDRPLDLVLVVYDLIKLIIEASLWTKDCSTFDNHTRRTRLFVQWMLISFVWLYMIKCDVYTQLLVDQTQFFFDYFICFWKYFYAFVFWVFVQITFFMFFIKNFFRGIFTRSSRLSSSRENELRKNIENTKF